jgi:type II secretory pathway pseudopilin PulG
MVVSNERGFTLAEAVIAVSLLAVGVSALAQVILASGRASTWAQQAAVVQQAARERLEQLRVLAWTSDNGGVPISDFSSDLSTTPPRPAGGVGLGISAVDTLLTNVAGYCDFLDVNGHWVAAGVRAPRGAAWVRRWSVLPLADDALLVQVLVVPAGTRAGATVATARGTNGAWLVDIRTRRTR